MASTHRFLSKQASLQSLLSCVSQTLASWRRRPLRRLGRASPSSSAPAQGPAAQRRRTTTSRRRAARAWEARATAIFLLERPLRPAARPAKCLLMDPLGRCGAANARDRWEGGGAFPPRLAKNWLVQKVDAALSGNDCFPCSGEKKRKKDCSCYGRRWFFGGRAKAGGSAKPAQECGAPPYGAGHPGCGYSVTNQLRIPTGPNAQLKAWHGI